MRGGWVGSKALTDRGLWKPLPCRAVKRERPAIIRYQRVDGTSFVAAAAVSGTADGTGAALRAAFTSGFG